MIYFAAEPLQQLKVVFEDFASSFFSLQSIVALIAFMASAILLGRVVAYFLRRVVNYIGRQADKSTSLQIVNRLRRYETMIVISIALIRTALVLVALYAWWIFIHPGQQPTALIGASAVLAILLGGALGPALRDISAGGVMMAEQWYGVGDHVRIEPFADMQGVVERVTLRSTRIQGLNGEVIWLNNQHIQGVRIIPRGIITMALEIFVTDQHRGIELIESVNRRLPTGDLLVISPLKLMTNAKVGDKLWHLTAVAETAPGREWMIEKYAIDVMKEIDEDRDLRLLATDPIARFADSEAERRFARAISKARKSPSTRKPLATRKPAPNRKSTTTGAKPEDTQS